MKSIVLGIVVAAIISVAAGIILTGLPESSADVYKTSNVRLD